jgi:hypothetical protein
VIGGSDIVYAVELQGGAYAKTPVFLIVGLVAVIPCAGLVFIAGEKQS